MLPGVRPDVTLVGVPVKNYPDTTVYSPLSQAKTDNRANGHVCVSEISTCEAALDPAYYQHPWQILLESCDYDIEPRGLPT